MNSSVYLGSLAINQVELHTVAAIHRNPTYDAALIQLLFPTQRYANEVVQYGTQRMPLGTPVRVRGWGTTGLNAGQPASVLQASSHIVSVRPPSLHAATITDMTLVSKIGQIEDGDSGVGVISPYNLVCSSTVGSYSSAVSTDAIAGWIVSTSSVGPARLIDCNPSRSKVVLSLIHI